jgi:hypothetical protein
MNNMIKAKKNENILSSQELSHDEEEQQDFVARNTKQNDDKQSNTIM